MASRQELVARARKLAPAIRERAGRTEELRQVPEETFHAFKDAGLLRAFVPREFESRGTREHPSFHESRCG